MNGSLRSLLDLVARLRALGVTPSFAVPAEGSFTAALRESEYAYHVLPLPWWVDEKPLTLTSKVCRVSTLLAAGRQLRDLVRAWKIDLVYTNTSVTPVGRLAAALTGLPHIWHIRELGDLHFSYHNLLPKAMTKRILLSSAAVICHAQAVREHVFPEHPKNVHLVYNGCATRAQFDALLEKRRSTPPHTAFTFAMLSSLSPLKGQAHAIQALAALHREGINANLLLAGGGRQDYTDQLKSLAFELGVSDRVEFAGLVDDPYPLYFAADCVLVCSEHEAFSRAGLEAMSTALPVIARNSGGSPELLVDGVTGMLYDTQEQLVDAMTRLAIHPDQAREMGLAGWQRAKEKFNIEESAANVYRIIQSVTGKPHA